MCANERHLDEKIAYSSISKSNSIWFKRRYFFLGWVVILEMGTKEIFFFF